MTVGKVYEAIAAVMFDLSKEGIGKTSKNAQQGYNFRGIDAIYNELSPILSRHKLCFLPRVLNREVAERQTKSGGALFYVTVEAEFDLVSSEDGSTHTIRTFGEAMDSADKATNKAMSAAYKYAAMQAFCIPTEGDNDADATTHEVAANTTPEKAAEAPARLSKADSRAFFKDLQEAIRTSPSLTDLQEVWKGWLPTIKQLPEDWENEIVIYKDDRKAELSAN